MTTHLTTALVSLAGAAQVAFAQPPMEPIGPTLRYEVSLPGGNWGSSVTIQPGDRVEWRAVVSYMGSEPAVALGQIYYQPILSNIDNDGAGEGIDTLGVWRNGGVSGQGNTLIQQGLLSAEDGASSSPIAFGYGRVMYGFTSRSTTAGSSGGLIGHRHTNGANSAPAGSWMRVAGSNNPQWYAQGPIINITAEINNRILWGVVSDNNTQTSTWFVTGTQNLTIFRQAFIASTDAPESGERMIVLTSESATLRRSGGGAGTDDTRFMTWARQGEGGSTASIRVGVEYIPATITIVPGPGVAVPLLAAAWWPLRRKRR
jgi:hypothetical protein